jgi:hypothetical protein
VCPFVVPSIQSVSSLVCCPLDLDWHAQLLCTRITERTVQTDDRRYHERTDLVYPGRLDLDSRLIDRLCSFSVGLFVWQFGGSNRVLVRILDLRSEPSSLRLRGLKVTECVSIQNLFCSFTSESGESEFHWRLITTCVRL